MCPVSKKTRLPRSIATLEVIRSEHSLLLHSRSFHSSPTSKVHAYFRCMEWRLMPWVIMYLASCVQVRTDCGSIYQRLWVFTHIPTCGPKESHSNPSQLCNTSTRRRGTYTIFNSQMRLVRLLRRRHQRHTWLRFPRPSAQS